MKSSYNNYGLSGQLTEEEYDNFLCLSRKCKQRKKERHEIRMAKRKAKVDARKADTERVRAETNIMKQTVTPTPSAPVATMPLTQQRIANPQTIAAGAGNKDVPTTQKAGFGGNTIMIVVGVLLVGGYLYQKSKKGATVPGQAAPALAA